MWRAWLGGAAIALLVLGCGGRDPSPYVATLDSLTLPQAWQVAQTSVKAQGAANGCVELINGQCPSVTRYFLVARQPTDALQDAKAAIAAQGFGDVEVTHPACDVVSSGPPCYLTARTGDIAIEVNVYRPGEDVDQLGLSKPDETIVRMIVHRH